MNETDNNDRRTFSDGAPPASLAEIAKGEAAPIEGDALASESSATHDSPASDAPALPQDAAGWRALVNSISSRDLLRLVQADKMVGRYVFAGFRAGGEAIRRPAVLARIIETAQRQSSFAALLGAAARLAVAPESPFVTTAANSAEDASASGAAVAETALSPGLTLPAERDDVRAREKLKELRAAVREKEARLSERDAQVATLTRDLAAARADAETERKGRRDAEASAERERRQRERDSRRVKGKDDHKDDAEAAKSDAPRAAAAPATTASGPAPTVSGLAAPVEEAIRRLLNRGKHPVAVELLKEMLAVEGFGTRERGAIHALLAAAHYGSAQATMGEEQDRFAIGAFLDAGLVPSAAEAFASLLAHGPDAPLRAADNALLQRLLALATRLQQIDAVQTTLARLRLTAPNGYQRLRRALETGGKKYAGPLFDQSGGTGIITRLRPDETIALPTTGKTASSVTPQRLVAAVDSGDENFITCARDGIETLRKTDPALVDALLESVAGISQVTIYPLTNALTHPVIVDASNVARYNLDPLAAYMTDAGPVMCANLLAMRNYLLRRGFFPVLLIADANLRFLIDDKATYLDLVERGVIRETEPGVEADHTLLTEARERVAPLITNDRLAEWGDLPRRIERLTFDLYPGGVVTLTPV